MRRLTTALLAVMAATGMGLAAAGGGHTTQLEGAQFAPVRAGDMSMPTAANCQPGTPGIVIHDDGVAENGYGFNADIVFDAGYAEPFAADAYPATITSVCYSFITNTNNNVFDFDIVVWDSDGPGGTPGTVLGSMPVVGHPVDIAGVPFPADFEEYDLSSLNLDITGPVFIGLKWDPQDAGAGIFVSADQSTTTPKLNGYSWSETADSPGAWEPLGTAANQPNYRALMVRAVMDLPPGPPSVGKSFSPSQVLAGAPSTVTLELRNITQPTAAELQTDFTDTLPTGLVIATPANAASDCGNATFDFTEGGSTFTLQSGATIPAESSCEVSFDVTAAANGSYENVIAAGALDTDHGANVGAASATLTVGYTFPEPYCNRTFSSSVEPITRVVFNNIDNPSSATVGGSPALENFTNLVGTAAPGQTVEMRVEGNTDGPYTAVITVYIDWNQDGLFTGAGESYNLGTFNGSTGVDGKHATGNVVVPADALLGETRMRVVKNFSSAGAACGNSSFGQAEDYTISIGGVAPPVVAKAFDVADAMTGDPIGVTITITNLNGSVMTLSDDFIDTLPAGLVATDAATTCNGTASHTAGTIELASGAEIPANDSCELTGVVEAAALGVYTNVIEVGDLVTDMGENLSEATATVEVFDAANPFPPVVAASFVPSTIFTDESSQATITLTNIASNPAVLTDAFTVVVPDGVDVTNGATTCGLVIGQDDPRPLAATNITLPAGMAIAANSSCEITFTAESEIPGTYVVTIAEGDLVTDQGTNVVAASATLTVNAGFPAPYCERNFTSTVEPITRVVFNDIDNASSPVVGGSPALENFTSIIGSASQGQAVETRVEGNTNGNWTASITAYIDWNQDGTFDANEMYNLGSFANSDGTDGKNATGDILVPADALLGETRMRVVKVFGSSAGAACGDSSWGQAEDYTLVINDDPLPEPLASVTPSSLELEAEEGDSDSGILTVHNDGPGRLEFNITRALPAARGPAVLGPSSYSKQLANPASIDPLKQAIVDSSRPTLGRSDAVLSWAPPFARPLAINEIAQMANNVPEPLNGISCGNEAAGTTSDNSWWRRFYFEEHPEVDLDGQLQINAVTVASETGSADVTINVYTTPKSVAVDTIDLAQLTLIGSGNATVGGELEETTVQIIGAVVADPEAVDLVVEYHMDSAGPPAFFPGGNASAQTHLTFISSNACEILTPTPTGAIGFPDFHIIMVVEVEDGAAPGVGCDSPSNVPWLTVSPANGTIDGIGSMDVTVTANSAGLAVGVHDGLVCVNTNDTLNPRFEIPVAFEVTESGPTDIIFQDGFEGEPVNPDIVVGMLNLPVTQSGDGSTFDFVSGLWDTYDDTRVDDINLYDFGDGLYVYWYGDATALDVGGVVDGAGEFAVLQSGDTVGPGQTISAASVKMINWTVGADGYLGIAFENEETGELNYGYLHMTTTASGGFPARVLEYAYNKAGDAITIP